MKLVFTTVSVTSVTSCSAAGTVSYDPAQFRDDDSSRWGPGIVAAFIVGREIERIADNWFRPLESP